MRNLTIVMTLATGPSLNEGPPDTYMNLLDTVDPHLSEHLGTKGWSDMRNVQITETGWNLF